MLRGIIVAPDSLLRQGLETRIADSGHVVLLRSFDHYPTIEGLRRFHRAHAPQVVYLDVATNPEIVSLAVQVARQLPGVHVVALHERCDPGLLMKLMNSGIRELLFPPFAKDLFLESVARLAEAIREQPTVKETTDLVFGFLPAKAGCGCSTLAMNVATALCRTQDSRVLLADFDLNSGIARFLLKLVNPFSIQDALERAGQLDETLWNEIISAAQSMDVLASGPISASFRPPEGAVRRLVEFASRRYRAVTLDFSGSFEEISVEALSECRRILLVVKPDLATVFLAREKLRFLRTLELEDRVSVVLNRWRRDACLSISDIESVVGLPVDQTISDQPDAIYQAVLNGAPVDPSHEMGKEITRLAVALGDGKVNKPEVTPKKRMVEYFSVLPARYSLFPGPRAQ